MCCGGSKGPVRVARSTVSKAKSATIIKKKSIAVERPYTVKPRKRTRSGVQCARSDRG